MATWVFIGDELAINPEQALTPQGKPLEVGVIAEGVVWMLDTTEAHYFTCDRQVLGANELSRVWIDNMIGEYLGYTISARGKGNPRLMGADPACFVPSLTAGEPGWRTSLSDAYDNFTGSSFTEGVICFASEDGNLYRIVEESPRDD